MNKSTAIKTEAPQVVDLLRYFLGGVKHRLTSYQLTVGPVADFTAGYNATAWEPIWEDFYCDWRELWFNQRVEPPSWAVGDMLIAAGVKGILFPSSLSTGGTNLVLFTQLLVAPDRLEVFDPGQSLPRSQASWH